MSTRPRPEGLTPLGRLSQYMNFERIHDAPPVVVTQDHRAVLVAAWAAQRQGLFGDEAPVLLRFDAHPDMGEKPRAWAYELAQLSDLDSVHAIANDQRLDDGGWVISAMQFGLAADVATCFVHDYHRFPGDSDPYADHRGKEHGLSTHGSLNGFLRSTSFRTQLLRDRVERAPLWIDIDLDFATRRAEDDSIREWTAEDWESEFPAETRDWLAAMLDRAVLVTVATEPWFCGGLGAAGRIAEAWKRTMEARGAWFARL